MTKRLEGKVAVVTGGGGGIGGGICLAMAGEGAKVVVNDISCDSTGIGAADKVVEQIKRVKGSAISNYDSVATMAGGKNIIKTAIDHFGRIDILVNCAGKPQTGPTHEITEEEWDSIMAIHLKGHFSCTKAAMVHMMQQKNGRIINFSSRGAFSGLGHAAYAGAKAGIMGFTAALWRELKPYHITVNAILPAAVTKGFPSDLTDRAKDDNIPIADPKAPPDFVAPIVVYLASDQARNITGRFIYASAGDICLYIDPFKISAAHTFIRKVGKWSVDELGEVIPSLLGLGG